MTENSICPHISECTVLIGHSLEKNSRHYKMFVCLGCGKYFDRLGDLSEFEKNVSDDVGRPWKWKEEFMLKEDLGSWDPMKNVHLVAIPYEPKNEKRDLYFIPNEIQAILTMILHDNNIECEIGDIWVSPSITTYTFKLVDEADLSCISALSNKLALAIKAHPIRVVSPITDTSLVGIEVPNENRELVSLDDELNNEDSKKWTGSLMVSLGRDTENKSRYVDLRKQICILMGGATGSGKSNFFHSIFASLTSQYGSAELKFIMADAKRIEFAPFYNGSPYLLRPVITQYAEVLDAFMWCVAEIDKRIALMVDTGLRKFERYNEKAKEKLPFIVVLMDEVSDFVVNDKDEKLISEMVRVIQTARLVGIAIVMSSSRLCSETFPPLLMENCPSRLAFSTASIDDSKFIIGEGGAEKLLGKGDGLFFGISEDDSSCTEERPIRLQTPYISEDSIYEHLSRH